MTTIDDPHVDGSGGSGGSGESSKFLGLHVDPNNMRDTYHRPDQKTLQDLKAKDMAIKLPIDSIQSTNTAGSGYVCVITQRTTRSSGY